MRTMLLALVTVRTPRDLDALALQTYVFGAVVGLIFLFLAAIVASVIKFEGGAHPKDPGKRRLWFWLLLVLSLIAFFIYNTFVVAPTVAPNLQGRFLTANLVGLVIALATYVIAGFAVSKIFSTGKLGNWFPSRS